MIDDDAIDSCWLGCIGGGVPYRVDGNIISAAAFDNACCLCVMPSQNKAQQRHVAQNVIYRDFGDLCVPSRHSTPRYWKIHNFAHTQFVHSMRFDFVTFLLFFFFSLYFFFFIHFALNELDISFIFFRFRMISLFNWNILTFQFFFHWQHTRQNVYTGPMTFSIERTSSSRLWHTKRDETWGAQRRKNERKKNIAKLTPTINKTAEKIALHDKGNNNMRTTTKISFWFS